MEIYEDSALYNKLKDKIDSLPIDPLDKFQLKWDLCDLVHEVFTKTKEALCGQR